MEKKYKKEPEEISPNVTNSNRMEQPPVVEQPLCRSSRLKLLSHLK